MKIKFNLERVLSVILLLIVSTWGIRQCSSRQTYRELFDERTATYKEETAKLNGLYNSTRLDYARINDSVAYFKQRKLEVEKKLKDSNNKIKQIRELYSDVVSKWDSNTSAQRKSILDSLFQPTGGSYYGFDSSQVYNMGYQLLKGKECLLIQPQLEFELETLKGDINNCYASYNNSQQVINSLIKSNDELLLKEDELIVKNKEFKKKNLWKTVYGVGVTGLCVLIVL